jgi:hypothetical protein
MLYTRFGKVMEGQIENLFEGLTCGFYID